MQVSTLMNKAPATCGPDDSLATAAGKMWDLDIGCLPVVDGSGRALGMLTDRDVCMAAYLQGRPLSQLQASAAMSREVFCCRPGDALRDAEEMMRLRQVRRLPVVDDDERLVGVLSLHDLVHEAERSDGRKSRDMTAQQISSTLAAVSSRRERQIGVEALAEGG